MKELKPLLFVAGFITFIYLMGAFASASFDISQWTQGQRAFCAFVMSAGSIMCYGISKGLFNE